MSTDTNTAMSTDTNTTMSTDTNTTMSTDTNTAMSTEHISQLHAIIAGSSIFRTDGPAIDLPAALIALANAVHELPDTDETEFIWSSVGEHTECPLGDLITGAYWALTDWHGGQSSDTYAAMCALGRVFSPGCSGGPEPDTCEYGVYEMINKYFESH